MIRSATSEDIPTIYTLAEAIGLFQPDELEFFLEMMSEHLEGQLDDQCWIVDYEKEDDEDDEESLMGAAYYAPEVFSQGVWNLHFIAVHPDHQGKGRGSSLLQYVEQFLMKQGERLLLVETSGMECFELTRLFYRKNGYDEEARIRDFYKPGDDKVIFSKAF